MCVYIYICIGIDIRDASCLLGYIKNLRLNPIESPVGALLLTRRFPPSMARISAKGIRRCSSASGASGIQETKIQSNSMHHPFLTILISVLVVGIWNPWLAIKGRSRPGTCSCGG